ncbi:fucolectin-7-like [Pomacea canaliculata]|uniref:fucolectin-7-like n=1 Tax=Pomacea canaliculata TaxID=400727 RepID=UPI000D7291A8|nr:fucolectin-7-like [Pomacea canaliculata]
MAGFHLQVHILFLMISSGFTQTEENVALSKWYTQSSFHPVFAHRPGNAANGNTDGHFDNDNCIHTHAGDYQPSWEVNLQQVYPVLNITIFGRTGFLRRLVGVSVRVDGVLCTKIRELPTRRRTSLSCATTLYGQRVKLEKELISSNSDENVLNICEVQIMVCPRGYFGDRCDRPCGKCRKRNSYCDRYTAKCQHALLPASLHWRHLPRMCCYKYGENCKMSCGRCKDKVACRHDNGHCSSGCAAGWAAPMCDTGNHPIMREHSTGKFK